MIKATALFDLLNPQQIDLLSKAGPIIKYTDGQMIHSRGAIKPGLSIVKSGEAHVGVYGADGHFILTGVLGPGECFGEFTIFTSLPRTHDISAVGNTEIHQIPANTFHKVCKQDPLIVQALLSLTLQRNHLLLESLDAIRRLPLLERTAKLLLTLSATSGNTQKISCTQSDLAFHLGVTRVSIGKMLKKLDATKLIELGYGEIRFPDIEHLKQWVDTHCNNTPM